MDEADWSLRKKDVLLVLKEKELMSKKEFKILTATEFNSTLINWHNKEIIAVVPFVKRETTNYLDRVIISIWKHQSKYRKNIVSGVELVVNGKLNVRGLDKEKGFMPVTYKTQCSEGISLVVSTELHSVIGWTGFRPSIIAILNLIRPYIKPIRDRFPKAIWWCPFNYPVPMFLSMRNGKRHFYMGNSYLSEIPIKGNCEKAIKIKC